MAGEQGPHDQPGDGRGHGEAGGGMGGMGKRGATRPMAGRGMRQPKEEPHDQGGEHRSGDRGGGHSQMTRDDRLELLRMHHRQTLWVYWTLVLLGAWTVLSPLTFGYGSGIAPPSGGRTLWLSDAARVSLMTWSDLASGALLVVFGWRSLTPGRHKSLWAACLVGIWLSMAPVVFWAPTGAAYLNGTVVGMLVISLAVLVPGMPGMILYMKHGPAQPPGWTYNPSSWPQRFVMIALGFAGFLVSRHLTAFQLGYIDAIWDPFFGDGTRRVLNSNMSHMWPISDAALGTFAYTLEFLMGFMGSPSRWRTMPWMVTFYGILVIPLGLVHIFLVISQPIVVGEWCTFCLLAAAIMLPMLPLEGDEVVAMGQHVLRARRRGESTWDVFWKGGSPEGAVEDQRSPELMALPQEPGRVLGAGFWGMSVPWTLLASVALGVWLVFLPSAFGTSKPASDVYRLAGLLTVTTAVIAMGEVFRLVRYLDVLLGVAVAAIPWFLAGATPGARLAGAVTGVAVAVLALPRGPRRERYGGWDRFVR